MKNSFFCKLRVNKLTLPYEAFPLRPCASAGICITFHGEKIFFPREEKNGWTWPRHQLPLYPSVNLLTLTWRFFWNDEGSHHAIRNTGLRETEQLFAVWEKCSNFAPEKCDSWMHSDWNKRKFAKKAPEARLLEINAYLCSLISV